MKDDSMKMLQMNRNQPLDEIGESILEGGIAMLIY